MSAIKPGPRDAHGLTLQARKFLQEITFTLSWQEAAANVGLSHAQVRRLFSNQTFKEEYDKLYDTEEVKISQRELGIISSDVVHILEDAKKAEMVKKIKATCPSCNHKFDVFTTVMDWATKLRVAEFILKGVKVVADEKSVKVEGNVSVMNIQLTTAEIFALAALNHGISVPPTTYNTLKAKLEAAGQTVPALPAGRTLEGDYRVITEEETHSVLDSEDN